MVIPTATGNEVHALLATFYHNSEEAMLITQFDSEDSLLCSFYDANPAACRIIGYEKEDLIKLNPDEVLFSNISSMLRGFIKEGLLERKHASHEIELRTKQNGNVLVEIKSSLIEFQGDRFVLHTLKDIEFKKEVQDEWLADRNITVELLNVVRAYILIMDSEGRIVSWNKYCEEKTGYSSDEVKGKAIWDLLVNEEEKQAFMGICKKGINHLESHESCWISKAGEKLHIQWSASSLKGSNTEAEYVIGSGINISDRKAYEESLLASSEKYRSLVEENPDGIVLFAPNDQIYLNKEAQSILGYSSEVAGRASLMSRVLPSYRKKAIAYFQDLTVEPAYSHNSIDIEITRPDSTRLTVEAKGITKKINGENLIHVVLRDVSDQKKAEENLRAVNRRMENVLSSTDEMIIGLDKNDRIIFINKSLMELLNVDQKELAGSHGQKLFDMLGGLMGDEKHIRLSELMKGDHTAEILLFPNGIRKYFELKVLPLGAEEGALITMYDITDRILLNRKREKYYDAIACGVTVQASNGNIIYANQTAAEIIGITKENLTIKGNDQKKWNIFDEDGNELQVSEHPWKKAITTGEEIINFVMGFFHPKYKELRWILVNTRNVLMDEESSVENVIATFHDITAKVEVDKIIKEKEKLALVGQLAAGVAHEVKNPLTSSLGFLKMMRYEKIVNQDYLDIILDELESINLVTSEFLALAEPQSIKMEDLCLYEDILGPLSKTMKSQLRKNGSEINFMIDGSKPCIRGVKDQVKQLFMNIFRNSVEAMPDGGIIDVSVIRENRNIVIRIKDEGIGISPERLKHLGEPFYSIKEKGTGLGLLLCKKIAHEHRGAIVIKSVQGRGTIVEVSLPAAESRMESLSN